MVLVNARNDALRTAMQLARKVTGVPVTHCVFVQKVDNGFHLRLLDQNLSLIKVETVEEKHLVYGGVESLARVVDLREVPLFVEKDAQGQFKKRIVMVDPDTLGLKEVRGQSVHAFFNPT